MICNPPSKNDLTSESSTALVCYNKFIMEEMQEKPLKHSKIWGECFVV